MNPFFGVFLHSIGGLAAGSFYVPLKKILRWSWESYWLIQALIAWVLAPWLIAGITTPDLTEVFRQSPISSLVWAYVFGVLWGIGGMCFGMAMRFLGMSLGYAMALGFCTTFGTLIPPLFHGNFMELLTDQGGQIIILGITSCLVGIALCGYAGLRKEKELTDDQKKKSVTEFSLAKGFIVAVIAGILSACFAFGLDAGKAIAAVAVEVGTRGVYQNNPGFILVMGGGFTSNLLCCLILNLKNRTHKDYYTGSSRLLAFNYLMATLAGTIWYGQFFFYGMGTTQMGKYDFSSWSIHMAFVIIFGNLWGILSKEWLGVNRKTWVFVLCGLFLLLFSTIVIGWGNALVGQNLIVNGGKLQ